MRRRVGVDRDLLASFDGEAAALAFIAAQFDSELVRQEVWLEVGDGDSARLVHGDELGERVRAADAGRRLSA